jgi:hypothetical protein
VGSLERSWPVDGSYRNLSPEIELWTAKIVRAYHPIFNRYLLSIYKCFFFFKMHILLLSCILNDNKYDFDFMTQNIDIFLH